MILKNQEMILISGGATNFSGSLLNAVAKLIDTVLGVGRAIGTAIRMATSGKKC